MNQPPDKLIALPAHGMTHTPWTRVIGWTLFVVGLALLLGASLPDLSRTPAGAGAGAVATPAFVFHDLRDHGEPREEHHRETPAKKARLTTLKVVTERTPAHARGVVVQFTALRPLMGTRSRDVPTPPAASGALHQPDPALSLHYGQAPPAA